MFLLYINYRYISVTEGLEMQENLEEEGWSLLETAVLIETSIGSGLYDIVDARNRIYRMKKNPNLKGEARKITCYLLDLLKHLWFEQATFQK